MKKFLGYLCVLGVLVNIFTFPVYASNMNVELQENELGYLANEMLEMVNATYRQEYGGKVARAEDIDFTKAYKVYVDVDIFEESQISETKLESMLAEAPEVWCVPVYYGDVTAMVEVSRGLPLNEKNAHLLTEEEKQEILINENQWQISRYMFYEGEIDFKQSIENTLNTNSISSMNSKYVLLGGVPGVQDIIAVIVENNYVTKVMLPDNNDIASESTMFSQATKKNRIYSYSEFKSLVQQINGNDDLMTENSSTGSKVYHQENTACYAFILIICGIIFVFGWGMALYLYKKDKRNA